MPRFRYIGEPERYYPFPGCAPEPGDVIEWDSPPADGRWELATDYDRGRPPAASPDAEEA